MQHDPTDMTSTPAPAARESGSKPGKRAGKGTDRVQFAWLNGFRRERRPMEVFLVNGHRIAGRIRSFDQRAILLESPTGEEILLLHHVISTIQPARGRGGKGGGGRPPRSDGGGARPPRAQAPRQPYGGEVEDDRDSRMPPPPRKPTVTIVRKHRRIVRDD